MIRGTDISKPAFRNRLGIIFLFLLNTVFGVWIWAGPGIFTSETYISLVDINFPFSLPQFLDKNLYAWVDTGATGYPRMENVALPFAVVFDVLGKLGLPLWILNRLWVVTPSVAVGLAAAFLYRSLFPEKPSWLAASVASTAAIAFFQNHTTALYGFSLAGFCIVLAGLARTWIRLDVSLKNATIIAAGMALLSINLRYALTAVITLVLWQALFVLQRRTLGRVRLKFLLVTCCLVMALNAFWLLHFLSLVLKSGGWEGLFSRAVTADKAFVGTRWSAALNVLWTSRTDLALLDTYRFNLLRIFPWAALTMLVPLMAYVPLVLPRMRRQSALLPSVGCALALTFLSTMYYYPFFAPVYQLITHVPGFSLLNNPGPWSNILGVLYAVLIAVAMDAVLSVINRISSRRAGVRAAQGGFLILLVSSIVSLGWGPFVGRNVGPEFSGILVNQWYPTHFPATRLPIAYLDLWRYLQAAPDKTELILNLMPHTATGYVTYEWWPYAIKPPSDMLGPARLYGGKLFSENSLEPAINQALETSNDVALARLMGVQRIRYIVLHRDYKVGPAENQLYSHYRSLLSRSELFSHVMDNAYFTLYMLSDEFHDPQAVGSALIGNSSPETVHLYLENLPHTEPVLITFDVSSWFAAQSRTDRDLQHFLGIVDGTVSLRTSLGSLFLKSVKDSYSYDAPMYDWEVTFSAKAPMSYALFAKPQPAKDISAVTPLIESAKLIPPNLADPLAQLLSSVKEWRYFGNVSLLPGRYSLVLWEQGAQPLKYWGRVERKQGNAGAEEQWELYEAKLPDNVPLDYTTQGARPKIIVYRDGEALKPTWDIGSLVRRSLWAGENPEEFYEVGKRKPVRVVINVPKGQKPTGVYTVAYIVPKLSDEVEEIIIAPLPVLEETANKILSLLQDPKYRVANLFTDPKDTFFVPKEEDYLAQARVSPNAWQSNVYLLPERTDWGKELAEGKWQIADNKPSAIGHPPSAISYPLVFYGSNWLGEERDHHGSRRWGMNNMRLLILNLDSQPLQGTLSLRVTTIRERDLDVAVNEQLVRSVHLPANYDKAPRLLVDPLWKLITGRKLPLYERRYPPEWTTVTLEDTTLNPGENELVLYTLQGTDVMDELLGNDDEREVSIQLWDDVKFEGAEETVGTKGTRGIGNTQYEMSVVDHQLVLNAYFDGDTREQEYVLMSRDFVEIPESEAQSQTAASGQVSAVGVDIEQYPLFQSYYTVSEPTMTTVDAAFGIDYTDDGQVDGYVIAPSTRTDGGMEISLNLFEAAKEHFPDPYYKERRDLRLVRAYLIPHKHWGMDVKNTGRSGLYTFRFGDINFYNDQSVIVPGYARVLGSQEELARWQLTPQNTRYETRITDDGTLLLSESFESQLLGVAEEEKQTGERTTFVLRAGLSITGTLTIADTQPITSTVLTQLTGDVEREDETTIYLKNVTELGGRSVAIAKDNISLTFAPERKKKEFQPEGVEMRMSLVQTPGTQYATRNTHSLNLEEYPFLGVTYKLQDPEVQTLGVELEVDTDGDGVGDTTLFPGTRETLKDWQYAGSFGPIDLYETTLSERFPISYTTSPDNPFSERFVVSKIENRESEIQNRNVITPTWGGWSYEEPLVQVGFYVPRRVVINLPAGATPQGDYTVSYLPMPQPSPLYDGYETLEINVAEVLEDVQGFKFNVQGSGTETSTLNLQPGTLNLTGLILHPKRIDTADVSAPDRKGTYTFFFKDLTFYKKLPYPVKAPRGKEQTAEIAGLFDMSLVKLDGQPITFQPPADQTNLLDRNGYWLEPITVTLEAGLYQDGLEILPHPTFKVDLVELANKPYEAKDPTAEVTFHKVNPTRYNVDVNAWDKFWLVFSESFHPGWKAYIVENPNDQSPNPNRPWYEWSALLTWLKERGRRTELTDHYLVNAYANGWYVPQTGQYRIVLEYWPQRLFEIGVIVSVTTLLACLGYLAYDGWRSWRKRAKTGKRQNAAESVTAS